MVRNGIDGVVQCECQRRRILAGRLRNIHDEFPQFAEASFDSFQPRDQQQEKAIALMKVTPAGRFFLWGGFDRGKTHLMIAQYRYFVEHDKPCLLRTSKQLIDELKKAELSQAYARDAEQEVFRSQVMDAASNAETFHLFWDDCEKAAARTDFRTEAIFELVDTLYRRKLGVTITSNLPVFDKDASDTKPIDLRYKLGNAVARRLNEMCTKIRV